PRWVRSRSDQAASDGRRMVMQTQWPRVAGGIAICTRSPPGREAESSGEHSSILCRVELAISFASLRHQSKSARGNGSQRQPERVSMKSSFGRLMYTSVTPGSPSQGRSGRRVSSRLEASSAAQLIHRPEIDVARDQYLDSIPLALSYRGRDVERALEDLGEHFLGR